MEYSVYSIVSEKDVRIYVGMSSDVQRRLKEHNAGFVQSTKAYRPWKLFHEEVVGKRIDARKREKYLKSGIGKEILKSLLYSGVAQR